MKVKFGDLTASQMKDICKQYKRCNEGCPLFVDMGSSRKECVGATEPWAYKTEIEIDLPDEEVEENAEIY